MNRNTQVRFVKPALEQLEERAQPSLLFGGNAVQQLAAPVDNALKDMQAAQAQLGNSNQGDFANAQKAAVTVLHSPTAANQDNFQVALGKVVSDYQRMLDDQHTIQAQANGAMNFLNAAAMSEFMAGDPVDLIILRFFPGSSFDPTTALTKDVEQANDIMDLSKNSDLKTDITFDFSFSNAVTNGSHAPITIQSLTTTPTT